MQPKLTIECLPPRPCGCNCGECEQGSATYAVRLSDGTERTPEQIGTFRTWGEAYDHIQILRGRCSTLDYTPDEASRPLFSNYETWDDYRADLSRYLAARTQHQKETCP